MTRRDRCLVQGGAVTREIPAPAGGVVIETFVPWKMVRRGVRKRIVTPLGEPEAFSEEAADAVTAQDTPLLRALGLAHHWQRLLDEGRVSSVDEIAHAEGHDVSYVRRLLRITLLAPELVGRLTAGASTGLDDLLGRPVPWNWHEQARRQTTGKNSAVGLTLGAMTPLYVARSHNGT